MRQLGHIKSEKSTSVTEALGLPKYIKFSAVRPALFNQSGSGVGVAVGSRVGVSVGKAVGSDAMASVGAASARSGVAVDDVAVDDEGTAVSVAVGGGRVETAISVRVGSGTGATAAPPQAVR